MDELIVMSEEQHKQEQKKNKIRTLEGSETFQYSKILSLRICE
jgi:hypothetical protein